MQLFSLRPTARFFLVMFVVEAFLTTLDPPSLFPLETVAVDIAAVVF
jgi:hypothetical protein